ncbi:putative glycolipid-binding domain-containing protein [Streptomyces polygonati]|uniref:Glycolipid-binding domain-containing protein n=1 Tax=Streptomyces polygonati TaxID=1617087 RepID=A0ABV8HGN2_9ACTN
MADERMLTWSVEESGGFESSWVVTGPGTLTARGRAVGVRPEPYWIEYVLETGRDCATRRLRVTAEDASGTRRLDLRCEGGRWTADGRPLPELDGAVDCDLGRSPLTNTMPVLRHRLHREPGEFDFLMAFVPVPGLNVRASRQRYTHLGRTDGGGRVRYASGDFRSDLEFDQDGLVLVYPGIARRLP